MKGKWNLGLAAAMLCFSPIALFGETVTEQPSKLYVSWDEYDVMVRNVAKQIYESEWEFDQIVCIARGGMFIGDSLSRIFNKPLAIISASSYRAAGPTTRDRLVISDRIAMTTDTLGKRILLVDDLVDSGVTLREIRRELQERYPEMEEIKTAVFWRKSGTTFEADFYANQIDKSVWLVMPFEIYEEIDPKDL